MQGCKAKNISDIYSFSPNIKRKRVPLNKSPIDILPKSLLSDTALGIYNGYSVEVNQVDHIRILYDCGCFGKGSKSRSCPEFIKQKSKPDGCDNFVDESLILDLEEAFFLTYYLKVLKIEDMNGVQMSIEQLIVEFSKVKANFVDNLVGYLYLRAKNWIVRAGTKFGANFLIYKKGLRYFHASFIVFIDSHQSLLPKDLKGLQRIAETSDKDVLFLEISHTKETGDILQNLDKFTVSENIIKRFNYNAYVQSK